MRAPLLLLLLFAGLSLHAPLARAQESADDQRARLHFEAGRSYFEEGNYEEALGEFQRSYALSHRAVLLVNVANCQERLGQWADAASSLEQFARTLPDGTERSTLERRIANLRTRASQHAGGAVETGGGGTGGGDGLLVPSLVAFGAGGAGLVAFAALGGLALAEDGRVAAGCGATRSCTPAEVRGMEDLALGADIALGVGLAGVAVGAVLILVDPPRSATADGAAVRVLPVVGASGGGLTVQGSV